MMRRFLLFPLLALVSLTPLSAQTPSDAPAPAPDPANQPASTAKPLTPAAMQNALDLLTQSNRDLLNLLKQQQAVLEDIQFDRRLQSRQIQQIEQRLVDSLQENAKLQAKVASLSAAAVAPTPAPAVTAKPTAGSVTAPPDTPPKPAPPVRDPDPPAPATYLPPEPPPTPGGKSWHRLFQLAGTDGRDSDIFHIDGHQWRVLWHNQDKPGKTYANTSALFINAFPKDDTIPQKVASKLGTGGDMTQLAGPGNFYLRIEASGGSWELAVEELR